MFKDVNSKKKPDACSTRNRTNFVDIQALIRSIQRSEGYADCFGSMPGHCDRDDCVWRSYCLKESADYSDKEL